jgi:hypothetical protein
MVARRLEAHSPRECFWRLADPALEMALQLTRGIMRAAGKLLDAHLPLTSQQMPRWRLQPCAVARLVSALYQKIVQNIERAFALPCQIAASSGSSSASFTSGSSLTVCCRAAGSRSKNGRNPHA